jgi:GH25 family lysozyme M1 (1,4-beta-N-acetylmuramidase)
MMAATSRFIDVSSYQGAQDWRALASGGLTGAQVKASEGEHTHDARYRMHMDGILSVPSLLPQAYHYGWPTQDAHAEADNYLEVVSGDAAAHSGFVHWLDLERRSDGANYAGRTSGQIRAWAEAWIDRVKAAHPHQRVGCYTSASDIKAGRYPRNSDALWYPAYPAGAMTYTQAEQRSRPNPGVTPLFWQFTSTPLDRSICYLTPAALRAWAGATTTVRETDVQLTDKITVKKGSWSTKDQTASVGDWIALANLKAEAAANGVKALTTQVAAQTAAITALAQQLGKGKDVATIVSAVQDAIKNEVVRVEIATVADDDTPAAPAAS